MEIEHFLHPEHPLVMKNVNSNEYCSECSATGNPCDVCGHEGECCYVCTEKMAGYGISEELEAYGCAACNIVMHKVCAEAPNVISSAHHNHPLTLISVPSVNSIITPRLKYICSQCDQYKDCLISVLLNYWKYEIVHKCHDHPLTLQDQEALEFLCNACGTRSKDRCFVCSKCSIWIHRKCAFLPTTMKNTSIHECTLELAYTFPKEYTNFDFNKCKVCYGRISRGHWLYYCGGCRFFVHVKCAATPPLLLSDDEDEQNLDRFPGPDRSVDLMTQLVKKMRLRDADSVGVGEITHWDHVDHPLTLWDDGDQLSKEVIVNYDGMVCEACIQPMMAQFYHCSQCSYYLHKSCALLPFELSHIEYPEQQLRIGRNSRDLCFGLFKCKCCNLFCNGLLYFSLSTDFEFCIHCANFPARILHESHKHPLRITRDPKPTVLNAAAVDAFETCNACGKLLRGATYICERGTCGSMYGIHFRCAMTIPHTLTHDYDKHPISLRYSPAPDHPSDYYCEICERDIDPTLWFYYCSLCQYSFHIRCLSPKDDEDYDIIYSKVKFGGIYQVDNHEHPLKFVVYRGNDSDCSNPNCRFIIYRGDFALECTLLCGSTFCLQCPINQKFVM